MSASHQPIWWASYLLLVLLVSCQAHPSNSEMVNHVDSTTSVESSDETLANPTVESHTPPCTELEWHSICLGSAKEEVLSAISAGVWTTDPTLSHDDLITTYHEGITLALQDVASGDWEGADFLFTDGVLTYFNVPLLVEEQLFRTLLEEWGQPLYVQLEGTQYTSQIDFWVAYPEQRVEYRLNGVGNPRMVTGASRVNRMRAFLDAQEYECRRDYVAWQGFGGEGIYYFGAGGEAGQHALGERIVREVPFSCGTE